MGKRRAEIPASSVPQRVSRRQRWSRRGVTALFLGSGTLHFVAESHYTAIVPKSLPNPRALVYISGVAEIAGGVGVQIPQTRRVAGIGLLALLVAVFPANINMAVNSHEFRQIPAWLLWARLPLQFAALAWVWRATQSDH